MPYHGHAQVVHFAKILAHGEDVKQGLGGVLANTVASIDKRLIQELYNKVGSIKLCPRRTSHG